MSLRRSDPLDVEMQMDLTSPTRPSREGLTLLKSRFARPPLQQRKAVRPRSRLFGQVDKFRFADKNEAAGAAIAAAVAGE
jgi:hypothetical protein